MADSDGLVVAERNIRKALDNCSRTKARQVMACGVIELIRVGRIVYTRKSELAALPERFADPRVQAAYANASYDNLRRERSAQAAAVAPVVSKSMPGKANA